MLAGYASLTDDQRVAAAAVLGSGRLVDTVVGPAGSGKTTTLRAIVESWQSVYGQRVLALAPSATAAHVLHEALGIRAETTAKWLVEAARNDERLATARDLAYQARLTGPSGRGQLDRQVGDLLAQIRDWQLSRADLVVLDEASRADTATLAAVVGQAHDAQAKVILVGDPAQRPAIGPCGGFGMLAHQHTTAQLTALHRFSHPWEAAAGLHVRAGDPRAIAAYRTQGRISAGDADDLLDRAVLAAARDADDGKLSLLQASDSRTVHELNTRAHTLAVLTGQAARDGGVLLADETTATVGDRVVTRRNDRRLPTPDGFVRNGALWDVLATATDGSLTVRPADHPEGRGPVVRLPAGYVRERVELGYATTTARSQGRTVDTSHTIVTGAMAREDLHVAITRGRHHNQLYVPTEPVDPDCPPGRAAHRDVDETLRTVPATNRIPTTAAETWAAHHPGEPVPVPTSRPQPAITGAGQLIQPYRPTPVAQMPPAVPVLERLPGLGR